MAEFGQPATPSVPLTAPGGVMADPSLPARVPYVGTVPMEGQASIDARKAAAQETNAKPYIQNLASHVRSQWTLALQAKRQTVEPRMLSSMRQRRGDYEPDVLAEIKKQGGSEIYMMLTSTKCRSASSWVRDVMMGTKNEKPWTISPTPLPDLPPSLEPTIQNLAQAEVQQMLQTSGMQPSPQDMEQIAQHVRDRVIAIAKKRAQAACSRMEAKMEDQMIEGHFGEALGGFIEDIVTFPSAILKGPVVRNKPKLQWTPGAAGDYTLTVSDALVLEWDRVDPFMIYPSPYSTNVDDGFLIERHKMTRQALGELKGVEGYSDAAIDSVLDDYGKGGLNEWLYIDTQKAMVEGKSVAAIGQNADGLLDALQFWGSVQGKLLVEWGMDKESIADPLKDYSCEVWLIGQWVIKAMVNPDPLRRKPYYKASYEEVPGAFWGNSVADLCRDSQTQCNVAARAIANNMGIASGPQVAYNVDRIPAGEDLTQLFPWKIHQYTSDPYGGTQKAVDFFAPPMVAQELMTVYNFFSVLADEHTGVPKYMQGTMSQLGEAGRTASGMSMMMTNAGKSIKQVVSNIDSALQQLLERLFFYNMRFSKDTDLKGDVNIIARGTNSLMVKENAQQRRNEFLQLVLQNPQVAQIVGEEAIAGLLRENVKTLDMDTDNIIPPDEVIRARVYKMAQQQAQMAAQAAQLAAAPSEEIEIERGPNGEMVGMKVMQRQEHVPTLPNMPNISIPMPPNQGSLPSVQGPGQTLQDGSPTTNQFGPMQQ